MSRLEADLSGTFLTERQAEVLSLRGDGHTQAAIAEEFGTSVANVSSIDRAARENVRKAERTVALGRALDAQVRFTVPADTDLRTLVDRVYEECDAAGIHVRYTDPELSAHLHDRLEDRVDRRRLTAPVGVGVTEAGEVLTFPAGDG